MDSFLLIRGIAGIVVGILAVAWPGMTIAVLVAIFGVYAIIDGITNLFIGFSRSRAGRSWALVVQGLVGIGAGVLTFVWPGVTALALVWFIAAWAIVTGLFEIAAAVRLRKVIAGEWLLALSGALSVAFGLLVFAFPGAGAVGIAFVLGAYAWFWSCWRFGCGRRACSSSETGGRHETVCDCPVGARCRVRFGSNPRHTGALHRVRGEHGIAWSGQRGCRPNRNRSLVDQRRARSTADDADGEGT